MAQFSSAMAQPAFASTPTFSLPAATETEHPQETDSRAAVWVQLGALEPLSTITRRIQRQRPASYDDQDAENDGGEAEYLWQAKQDVLALQERMASVVQRVARVAIGRREPARGVAKLVEINDLVGDVVYGLYRTRVDVTLVVALGVALQEIDASLGVADEGLRVEVAALAEWFDLETQELSLRNCPCFQDDRYDSGSQKILSFSWSSAISAAKPPSASPPTRPSRSDLTLFGCFDGITFFPPAINSSLSTFHIEMTIPSLALLSIPLPHVERVDCAIYRAFPYNEALDHSRPRPRPALVELEREVPSEQGSLRRRKWRHGRGTLSMSLGRKRQDAREDSEVWSCEGREGLLRVALSRSSTRKFPKSCLGSPRCPGAKWKGKLASASTSSTQIFELHQRDDTL